VVSRRHELLDDMVSRWQYADAFLLGYCINDIPEDVWERAVQAVYEAIADRVNGEPSLNRHQSI
jgi:hypothetical protein